MADRPVLDDGARVFGQVREAGGQPVPGALIQVAGQMETEAEATNRARALSREDLANRLAVTAAKAVAG